MQVGTTLPETVVAVDRARLLAYAEASGDHNPIHRDESMARSVGLPNVIAHGMLTMGLAMSVAEAVGGPGSVRSCGARFSAPVVVPAGQSVHLVVGGKVTAVVDGVATVTLDVRVDGQAVLGKVRAEVQLREPV